jgi:predicted TIM-barrel fold metal-dependent hydrolase
MKGMGEPECWFSDKWMEIFKLAESSGLLVLWHVTQRVSYSPYHGGGLNPYWAEGQEKGVRFTNEDLLQAFLKILKTFPRLKVIGAHQLHIGLDRLSSLLDEYDNLFIDTSCGFYLRWADTLYEEDRKVLWEFFMKYRERILFGSDSGVSPNKIDEYLIQGFLCHARFINQLRLPYDVLQLVSHENSERLFGLEPVSAARRGNVRP